MFKAFNDFIVTLFGALNNLASAAGHLSTWADETAGAFEDEARADRQKKLLAMNKEIKAINATK